MFCSEEVTLDWFMCNFRMKAGDQKDQTMIRNLELAIPLSILRK